MSKKENFQEKKERKKSLPLRIHWTAGPEKAPGQLEEVGQNQDRFVREVKWRIRGGDCWLPGGYFPDDPVPAATEQRPTTQPPVPALPGTPVRVGNENQTRSNAHVYRKDRSVQEKYHQKKCGKWQ